MAFARIAHPSVRTVKNVTGATSRNNVRAVPIVKIVPTVKTAPNARNRVLRATNLNPSVQNPSRWKPTKKRRNAWSNQNIPNIRKAQKRGRWIDLPVTLDV